MPPHAAQIRTVRLQPLLQERPWGGDRLASMLRKPVAAGASIGESWEACDLVHLDRREQSRVATGPYADRPLGDLIGDAPQAVLGDAWGSRYQPGTFPLLVKFLDARATLSVQVHPDHAGCLALEGVSRGKTEAWVVLHADPGARIHRGLRDGIGIEEARDRIRRGRVREIRRCFPARARDVVFLPPGTVHALGAGLVVAEIQEPSDYTYRIDDWGRVGSDGKPRALHRDKAAEVVRIPERGEGDLVTPDVSRDEDGLHVESLVEDRAFRLERWTIDGECPDRAEGAPRVLLVLEGSGRVLDGDEEIAFDRGDALLVPALTGSCRIVPRGRTVLLRVTPGPGAARRSRETRSGGDAADPGGSGG